MFKLNLHRRNQEKEFSPCKVKKKIMQSQMEDSKIEDLNNNATVTAENAAIAHGHLSVKRASLGQ